MKRKIIIASGIIIGLFSIAVHAQNQTVKGVILDAQVDYPLIGATIRMIDSNPLIGTVTDLKGKFRLENVPVGRQSFQVSYLGYKNITLPNVLVTAGKEVVLYIKLEESVEKLSEIVVTAEANKDMPINELAKVSARTFSLEEVTRFSGGRNDVARLVASFAGVSAPNDSRNDIVVRGNSPTGLLWRIDGLPIANVNHYATLGTTGGPVSALNTNILRTSDFITGAFPAEYGNANGAVFDLNFRNGNADKLEFTLQAAFSGLEFMAEGPISKKNNSSFVASYRYGIASLAATGTSAIPFYQDFSFKVNLGDSKIGRFEITGLGGKSSIDFLGNDIDEEDLFANPNEDAFVNNSLGFLALSHLLRLNKTTYVKTVVGASGNTDDYIQDNLLRDNNQAIVKNYRATNSSNKETRYSINSTLNKKFNARWSLRTGFLAEQYKIEFSGKDRDNQIDIPDNNNDQIPDYFITFRDIQDSYVLSQYYGQAEYKFTDNLTTTFGVHSQYHSFTGALSIEPRAALSWQFKPTQRFSMAYGNHAQSIPSPILFIEEELSPQVFERTNTNLDFMKSHHFVLGYDNSLSDSWRLKTEVYYQSLYNIPIESVPGSYSIVNEGAGFVFQSEGSLVNEGTGRNYGVELTLEKFFSQGYYMLFTTSVYDSQYKGSDGVLRSTAFNNQYVLNVLMGKEWKFGKNKQNAWTFDTKFTTAGGRPFTPIDIEQSRLNGGDDILFENLAFSENLNDYFRLDIKFGVRINSANKSRSHQFFIDLQNITNRENEFTRRYNEVTDQVNRVNQIGFFPDILYRFNF